MNNIAHVSNYIGYKGILKSKLNTLGKQHSVTLHNTGLTNLFTLIAAAVTGNNVSNILPKYLDIRYYEEAYPDNQKSILRKPLPFTGIVYNSYRDLGINDVIGSEALFNATLTVSDILPTSLIPKAESIRFKVVMLCGDMVQELAEIKDTLGSITISNNIRKILLSVDKNTFVDFEWELNFSNSSNIEE